MGIAERTGYAKSKITALSNLLLVVVVLLAIALCVCISSSYYITTGLLSSTLSGISCILMGQEKNRPEDLYIVAI